MICSLSALGAGNGDHAADVMRSASSGSGNDVVIGADEDEKLPAGALHERTAESVLKSRPTDASIPSASSSCPRAPTPDGGAVDRRRRFASRRPAAPHAGAGGRAPPPDPRRALWTLDWSGTTDVGLDLGRSDPKGAAQLAQGGKRPPGSGRPKTTL